MAYSLWPKCTKNYSKWTILVRTFFWNNCMFTSCVRSFLIYIAASLLLANESEAWDKVRWYWRCSSDFFENYHFLNFIVSFSYNVHKSAKFVDLLNPLNSKGSYSATSNNMVIGTLAVDGWTVTFGIAMRGLGGLRPHPVPSLLYHM